MKIAGINKSVTVKYINEVNKIFIPFQLINIIKKLGVNIKSSIKI